MKRIWIGLLVGIIVLTAVGCGQQETPEPSPVLEQGQPVAESDPVAESVKAPVTRMELTSEKLPLWEGYDRSYEKEKEYMARQIVLDQEEAYQMAWQIGQVAYYIDGCILNEFEGTDNLHTYLAMKTALFHTTPIYLDFVYDEETNAITAVKAGEEEYPNHELVWLYNNEMEEGRQFSDVFYYEDIYDVMVKLFGKGIGPIEDVYFFDQAPYYNYRREGVMARVGDFGGPWGFSPLILSIEEGEGKRVVQAIPCLGFDRETPMEYNFDGAQEVVEVTEENLDLLKTHAKIEQFTFEDEEGRWILTGYKVLQKETLPENLKM